MTRNALIMYWFLKKILKFEKFDVDNRLIWCTRSLRFYDLSSFPKKISCFLMEIKLAAFFISFSYIMHRAHHRKKMYYSWHCIKVNTSVRSKLELLNSLWQVTCNRSEVNCNMVHISLRKLRRWFTLNEVLLTLA